MKLKRTREPGLMAAIDAVGGTLTNLSSKLDITVQSVANWRRVPPLRVIQVERATGVPRTVLRPDIYPADDRATA
jgi:DNA-binding transcriptional regulator YdaS (Cro superfamily)